MLELLLENLSNPLKIVRITLKISEEIYHLKYVTMLLDDTDPLEGPDGTLTLLDFITQKKLTFNIKDIVAVFSTNEFIVDLAYKSLNKYKEILAICSDEKILNDLFFRLEFENYSVSDLKSENYKN